MIVFNNINKRWEPKSDTLIKGIVYINDTYVEFGYFELLPFNVPLLYNDRLYYVQQVGCIRCPIYWSNSQGCYVLDKNLGDNTKLASKYIFNYPIKRSYNFSKLNLKQRGVLTKPDPDYESIKQFTLGLEYETSSGNAPWLTLQDANLVPLYDGSITGHEYVTFPLVYEEFSIIRNHLNILKYYTDFDKNCSLHVHFGNFPIHQETIERLVKFWRHFQWDLAKYLPYWSYAVENYKSNGKAYNKPLLIRSLVSFYEKYTGNQFEDNDSFYLPNTYDANEIRKWEVQGRYYNMNIMHLISGKEHKTVEFRFLSPTTNYDEIKWYILVLGAFLRYVIESNAKIYKGISVQKVITYVFPKDLSDKLLLEGKKLYNLHKIQINSKDFSGTNRYLKDLYLYRFCNFKL